MTSHSSNRRRAACLLLFAGLVFFALSLFPFGWIIQWPFVILTTFIHELGHGLTAILVGGKFVQNALTRNEKDQVQPLLVSCMASYDTFMKFDGTQTGSMVLPYILSESLWMHVEYYFPTFLQKGYG